MKLAVVAALFFGLMPAFAQQPPAPAPKPPVVSDAVKAHYWKAQAEFQKAQTEAQQAAQAAQQKQVALQASIEDLKKACGDDFVPLYDSTGEVACTAKPKPPETKAAPTEKKK